MMRSAGSKRRREAENGWSTTETTALRRLQVELKLAPQDIAAVMRRPLSEVRAALAELAASAAASPAASAAAAVPPQGTLTVCSAAAARAEDLQERRACAAGAPSSSASNSAAPSAFSADDDLLLIALVAAHGPSWTQLAARHFKGRHSAARLRSRYRFTLEPFLLRHSFADTDAVREALVREVHGAVGRRRLTADGALKATKKDPLAAWRQRYATGPEPLDAASTTSLAGSDLRSEVETARHQVVPAASPPPLLPPPLKFTPRLPLRPRAAVASSTASAATEAAPTGPKAPSHDPSVAFLDWVHEAAGEDIGGGKKHDVLGVVSSAVLSRTLGGCGAGTTSTTCGGNGAEALIDRQRLFSDDFVGSLLDRADEASRALLRSLSPAQLEALQLAYLHGGEEAFRNGLRQLEPCPHPDASAGSFGASVDVVCPMWSSVAESPAAATKEATPAASAVGAAADRSSPGPSPPPPHSQQTMPSLYLALLFPVVVALRNVMLIPFAAPFGISSSAPYPHKSSPCWYRHIHTQHTSAAAAAAAAAAATSTSPSSAGACPFYTALSRHLRRCTAAVLPATLCCGSYRQSAEGSSRPNSSAPIVPLAPHTRVNATDAALAPLAAIAVFAFTTGSIGVAWWNVLRRSQQRLVCGAASLVFPSSLSSRRQRRRGAII